MTTATNNLISSFRELNLPEPLLKVLEELGYETPTPIQSEIIPYVLAGKDVLGQAQTGTGKTAAFALPLLARINLQKLTPQVVILTPTRELAIQVSEAFQKYATHLKGFHVMPIYGGQSYSIQLKQLNRGVHVVVGTPGRVMDHIRKKTLSLSSVMSLVLDEADEMLRMGFIEDVKWILEQTPPGRQLALFSATIPLEIKKIAQKHQHDPQEVTIKLKTTTAETIRQRYWVVTNVNKLDALTRILESEESEGIIIFVRTKLETIELADKLNARGYACTAINGDIAQNQREKTVEDLKSGKLDILIATDVAARGLDVERISHVINYDIPYDTESYIHRIGRTGRAGRSGDAILFVSPRERRMLSVIQKATGKTIEEMVLPSRQDINDLRIVKLKQRIFDTVEIGGLEVFSKIVEEIKAEKSLNTFDIAAALAKMLYDTDPHSFPHIPKNKKDSLEDDVLVDEQSEQKSFQTIEQSTEPGMVRYRIEVGNVHGVKVNNIIRTISSESGLDGSDFGKVNVYEDFSTIDIPEGMPKDVYRNLKKVKIAGQLLKISKVGEDKKPEKRRTQNDFPKDKKSKRQSSDNRKKDINKQKPKSHKKRY
ncbi:MAG: DEAD/DEAH box helicase [Leptospiraceae bacterium]|nr:DEAD/DEAH box helicase [Leptospiraceae bacterium]MCP5494056.1 DEAD/DEAH box helicase [Leptospiraceae bacterium]